jgi:hypothetical protein
MYRLVRLLRSVKVTRLVQDFRHIQNKNGPSVAKFGCTAYAGNIRQGIIQRSHHHLAKTENPVDDKTRCSISGSDHESVKRTFFLVFKIKDARQANKWQYLVAMENYFVILKNLYGPWFNLDYFLD